MLCCLVELQFCEALERLEELPEDWRHLGLWVDYVIVIVEVKDPTTHGPCWINGGYQLELSYELHNCLCCACLYVDA